MTRLAVLAVLLAAAPAAAQEAPVSTAAVQASTAAVQLSTVPVAAPLSPLRTPPLRHLLADINRLMANGGGVPPEKLEDINAKAAALRAKVREALGRDILDEIERQEAPLRAEAALQALAAARAALQAWYAAHGGSYPASPAELVPSRLQELPWLELPGHEPTNAVTVIDSKKYDGDAAAAVTDSGGWLYFAAPGSDNYGLLLLDCRHLHPGGVEFYKY